MVWVREAAFETVAIEGIIKHGTSHDPLGVTKINRSESFELIDEQPCVRASCVTSRGEIL